MEEQESKIIELINEKSYVPMKAKQIASLMEVPKDEYADFRKIIDKLISEFKIKEDRKGRISIVQAGKYETGVVRANEKGFGFVKIENKDEEIYVSKRNMNSALNEDTVIVELTNKEENYHQEGKIVKVVKRGKNILVGRFENSRNFGFVVPDDKKFGSDIFISKKNFNGAKNNQKVLVQITKYPQKGKRAEGKITEVIGFIDEAGVDMMALIKDYNLPYEFPENVMSEVKNINSKVSEEEKQERLDLRQKTIFTIDGEDAKDLDDAVCVERGENGTYKLTVSIADVSNYVKEGSELDKEAIIRGTSIYMMDRVIPMLPKELSNGICSLNAGVDRLALTCLMEIDKNGKVISSDIKKSVINVKERMSYTQVFNILQNEHGEELSKEALDSIKKYKPYINDFLLMEELAKILKAKREKAGSLELDVPESKITLDNRGVAINVEKYETNFAHEIIEQFMLITNETVAEKFFWLEAPFIYRVHDVPDTDKIDELNKFLYNLGYKIKYSKDSIHPKAFAEVLEEVKGKPEERVVSNLILRTLKLAKYESTNRGHFGIASKYYCHFTSPIRRYPDLYIHRIISKYLAGNYNVSEDFKEKYLVEATKYAEQSSEREKIATKVERDSEDIKKAEYMQDKVGEVYEGIVSSITSFGIFVELENTVEGLIRFENIGDEYYVYDQDSKRLIGEHTKNTYEIGQKVTIRVIEANKETRRISFEIYTNDSLER